MIVYCELYLKLLQTGLTANVYYVWKFRLNEMDLRWIFLSLSVVRFIKWSHVVGMNFIVTVVRWVASIVKQKCCKFRDRRIIGIRVAASSNTSDLLRISSFKTSSEYFLRILSWKKRIRNLNRSFYECNTLKAETLLPSNISLGSGVKQLFFAKIT